MAAVFVAALLGGTWLATPTPLRFVAEVDDVYSLRTNPAGLGWLGGRELRLLYARDGLSPEPGEPGAGDGVVMFAGGRLARGLALAGSLDLEVDGEGRTGFETSVGLGVAPGALALGVSWDHVDPAEGPAKNRLNSGLGVRWNRFLATALAVRDVTQTVGSRTWDLGVALRPWDPLVLSGVWRLSQGRAAGADLGLRVAFEPLDGMTVGAGLDRTAGEDLRISGQLAFRFEALSVGAAVVGLSDNPSVLGEVSLLGDRRPSKIVPRVVAVLSLSGSLVSSPELTFFPLGLKRGAYADVPLILAELRTMPQVDGLLVKMGPLDIGWAKAAELRRGLQAFSRSGRRVHCVLSAANDLEVFVASGCSQTIMLAPVLWSANGLSAETVFFAEGLERLGVSVQVVRQGIYKSTPERFTRKSMSPQEREALGAYLDDVYAALVGALAEGRRLPKARIRELLDDGVRTASAALKAGLVDAILYPDEIEDHLNGAYGRSVRFVPAFEVFRRQRPQWSTPPRIAIIHIDAAISSGESRDLPLGFGRTSGATTILEALDRVRRDRSFAAAVLRVDSPGGDALASDLIARAVAKLDEDKPVIASFGDVAASGGYYVAAPARTIFAEETTLTGSIGVFYANASFERLLERIGLQTSAETRGRVARAGSAFTDWTQAEREQAVRVVDHYYQRFLQTVGQGRDWDEARVRAAAAGRIWSGRAARKLGLVDFIGGLREALDQAKKEAGLLPTDSVELVTFPDGRQGLADAVQYIAHGESPSGAAFLPAALRRLVRDWGTVFLESGPSPVMLTPIVVDID